MGGTVAVFCDRSEAGRDVVNKNQRHPALVRVEARFIGAG